MKYYRKSDDHDVDATATYLVKEDVDFLFEESRSLNARGFGNLGKLFPYCRNHPWASYARQVFERHKNETTNYTWNWI